jgi:hypothetical protein
MGNIMKNPCEHMETPWELDGNTLGTRKNMKSPHPNPKINKSGTLECMFSLSICCMNLFFAKLLITYFGLDEYPHLKT